MTQLLLDAQRAPIEVDLPVPPKEAQGTIVDHVARETAKLDLGEAAW